MKKIKDSILIGNCCDNIYCKKYYINGKYEHPWYACCMMGEDYFKFIKEFENIDFNKFIKLRYKQMKISKHKNIYSWNGHNIQNKITTAFTVGIQYENGVQVMYPHYYEQTFTEKYYQRLNRFKQINKNDIIFMIRIYPDYTNEMIKDFYELPVNKIILISPTHNLSSSLIENENTKIIITNKFHNDLVNYIKEYDK